MMILVILTMWNMNEDGIHHLKDDFGYPHRVEHEDGDHHLIDVSGHHDHCPDP